MAKLPLIPSPEVLTQLRERMIELDYTEERAAEAIDLPHLGHFFEQAHSTYRYSVLRAEPKLATLVRMFLLTDPVDMHEAIDVLGQELLVGLVRGGAMAAAVEGYVRSRYILSPIDGAFILTDRRVKGDENRIMPLGHDTYNLVTQTQKRPGATVLDLGTGSGVQGVLAARWASRVLSVDINERALDFARMNAHLNGVYDKMEFKLGSLYDPAEGERFDVILANPPFVPNPEYEVYFRDGGVQGEDILHIIIRDAPAHMKPGGILQIMTEIIYHDEHNAAQKTRIWAEDQLRGVIFEQDDGFLDIYAEEHIFRSYDAEDTNQSLQTKVREYQKFLDSVGIWKITHATLHLTPDEVPEDAEPALRHPVALIDVANLRAVSREQVAQAMAGVAQIREPGWLDRFADARVRFDPGLRVTARWVPATGQGLPTRVEFEEGMPWRPNQVRPEAVQLLRLLAEGKTLGEWLASGAELLGMDLADASPLLADILGDMLRSQWAQLQPAVPAATEA